MMTQAEGEAIRSTPHGRRVGYAPSVRHHVAIDLTRGASYPHIAVEGATSSVVPIRASPYPGKSQESYRLAMYH